MINLDDQATDIEAPTESIGGGGFTNKTGIYPATIKGCYYGEAKSGASFLKLTLGLEGGADHSEQIYFSSSKANGQRITYEKDDKKHLLPGAQTLATVFYAALADNISGKETLQEVLTKVIKANEDQEVEIWDFQKGKLVKKQMPVLTAVIGKTFLAGIKEVIRPRSVSTDAGYVDSANEFYDSRNELSLVFTNNKISPVEIIAGDDATSHDAWLEKWEGEVVTIKPRKQKGNDPIESLDGKPVGEAKAEVSESTMFG